MASHGSVPHRWAVASLAYTLTGRASLSLTARLASSSNSSSTMTMTHPTDTCHPKSHISAQPRIFVR